MKAQGYLKLSGILLVSGLALTSCTKNNPAQPPGSPGSGEERSIEREQQQPAASTTPSAVEGPASQTNNRGQTPANISGVGVGSSDTSKPNQAPPEGYHSDSPR